jgi:hypothetical protein
VDGTVRRAREEAAKIAGDRAALKTRQDLLRILARCPFEAVDFFASF